MLHLPGIPTGRRSAVALALGALGALATGCRAPAPEVEEALSPAEIYRRVAPGLSVGSPSLPA